MTVPPTGCMPGHSKKGATHLSEHASSTAGTSIGLGGSHNAGLTHWGSHLQRSTVRMQRAFSGCLSRRLRPAVQADASPITVLAGGSCLLPSIWHLRRSLKHLGGAASCHIVLLDYARDLSKDAPFVLSVCRLVWERTTS